jgi:putative acetyltransferase
MTPSVRREEVGDAADVRLINEEAFGSSLEADIVESLRTSPGVISLVATLDGRVAGHILFTAVALEPPRRGLELAALGPMAVRPHLQRHGIGTHLVRAGLLECSRTGYRGVVVVGHPNFYPRFGFRPAAGVGLRCEFPVPDDVFMVLELERGALEGVSGVVHYPPEFSSGQDG